MEWLKKNFLSISIKSQINFGILTVSICVCVLVFVLLGINVFILLNMSYTEILQIIDTKETQQIDATSLYIDFKIFITSEQSKMGIQLIRNMIENLKRNKDFIKPFSGKNVENYVKRYTKEGYSDCSLQKPRNCVMYSSYGSYDENELNDYITRVALSFPFFNKTFDYRFIDFKDQTLYNHVILGVTNLGTVFMFPYVMMDPRFNEVRFKTYMLSLANVSDDFVDSYNNTYIKNEFYDIKPLPPGKTYASLFKKSPMVQDITYITPQPFIIKDPGWLISFSPKYNTELENIDYNLKNPSNLIDVITGDWDTKIIDLNTFSSINCLSGIKILITRVSERNFSLITPSGCNYFRYFYDLQNNLGTQKFEIYNRAIYNTTHECFDYLPGKKMIWDNFFTEPRYDQRYIKRKVYLPLINKYGNTQLIIEDSVFFKVGKYLLPESDVINYLRSDFFTFTQLSLYVYKNESFIKIQIKFIFIKTLAVLIRIVVLNLFVWYLLIFIIIILLIHVTDEITTPINKICEQVTCMGQENGVNPEIAEDFGEIDAGDQDINELFKLCFQLIKGGFSDQLKSKTSDDIMIKYIYGVNNNISFIKTNNLLVDEDRIESSSTNNASSLFYYKKRTFIYDENATSNEPDKTLIKIRTTESLLNTHMDNEKQVYHYLEDFGKNLRNKHFLYQVYQKEKINILSTT